MRCQEIINLVNRYPPDYLLSLGTVNSNSKITVFSPNTRNK